MGVSLGIRNNDGVLFVFYLVVMLILCLVWYLLGAVTVGT